MGRNRFSGEGSRPGSAASGGISPHGNRPGRGFSKHDAIMLAGRLAAEYLVSKGKLPAKLLPADPPPLPENWHRGARWEPKNRSRESSMPAPPPPPAPPLPPERRTSALARLGNADPDAGYSRRRFHEEQDRWGSRKRFRDKGKEEHYGKRHDSDWGGWGRPRGRNGMWAERGRGYSDNAGPEDFAPGFRQGWRGIPRAAAADDELLSGSEATGESGSDRNYEFTGEVKSRASGDMESRNSARESWTVLPSGIEDGRASEHDKDPLKLSSLVKVPTRPRSLAVHRSPKRDRVPKAEIGDTVEAAPTEAGKVTESSSSDLHANQANTSKCHAIDGSLVHSVQLMEEYVNPQDESFQNPPGSRVPVMTGDEREEDGFAHFDKREEIKRERVSSPLRLSMENEHSPLHNLKAPLCDVEMIEAVDHEQPAGDAVFPQCASDSTVKLDEKKQFEAASDKICDLNLMGSPEITEIPDDPVSNHQLTSLPSETEKQPSVDIGPSACNNVGNGDDCSRLSDDDKVVPVINVEDDSPIEDNVCGSSKPKNEAVYSSLENVLNHTPLTDELPGIHGGYNISELLGGGISRCPSVQADLNNLQAGMSLQGTEGFPGDDDPIYVSLEELPIGYMEVWGQPSQDYDKLF